VSYVLDTIRDKKNVPSLVRRVLADEAIRDDVVRLTLTHPDIMVYYHGYYVLDEASRASPELFAVYWDDFIGLLEHANSYHRDIGLTIVANLTAADGCERFSGVRDRYLRHIYDVKFMTGNCCVTNLARVAKHCPGQREHITRALLAHQEGTAYTEKQEAVLQFDILRYLELTYTEKDLAGRFAGFITSQCHSTSPKTRKRAIAMRSRLESADGS
jgi:hypothetical protein